MRFWQGLSAIVSYRGAADDSSHHDSGVEYSTEYYGPIGILNAVKRNYLLGVTYQYYKGTIFKYGMKMESE